jgi:ankyrin repeat protein
MSDIHDAARDGDLEKVKALLNDNPDFVFSKDHNFGQTPLHWALYCEYRCEPVVQLLLAHNAEVNTKDIHGETPLHTAARRSNKALVELLLAHKAEVNAKGNAGQTPLHCALGWHPDDGYEPDEDLVRLLLARGAEVNAKDGNGITPLHEAVSKRRKDLVELLLAHKAEVNTKDGRGLTPLSWVGYIGGSHDFHEDMRELLRQHGGHE